jgi:hypothetical protein
MSTPTPITTKIQKTLNSFLTSSRKLNHNSPVRGGKTKKKRHSK